MNSFKQEKKNFQCLWEVIVDLSVIIARSLIYHTNEVITTTNFFISVSSTPAMNSLRNIRLQYSGVYISVHLLNAEGRFAIETLFGL